MPADIHARLLALTSPFAAEIVRIARAEGHAAGLASGLERGRRDAQTEIDGLTYERGRDDERARCEAIVQAKLDKLVSADMLVALAEIRDPERYTRQTSGEPAPEAK